MAPYQLDGSPSANTSALSLHPVARAHGEDVDAQQPAKVEDVAKIEPSGHSSGWAVLYN